MRIHLLERTQRVELPLEAAFSFYGDPANLEPLTPPWLHFRILTPLPITDKPRAPPKGMRAD